MRNLSLWFVSLFCSPILWAEPIILDVLAIRGASEVEVETHLGAPLRCNETYYGEACDYIGGIEVVFIRNQADWIQVVPQEEIPFEPSALRHIGLLPALPTVRNPFRMHWEGHQGLSVVSLYGSGQYVAMFQVRAFSAP